MNSIELKFFKLIELKPEYQYDVIDTMYVGNSKCYTVTRDDLLKSFNPKNKRFKVIQVHRHYPTINIVKLEEQLFKTNLDFISLNRCIDNNGKFVWLYSIVDDGEYYENKNKTYNDFQINISNVDRKTALLKTLNSLLTNSNFDYKDELISRIKHLFN